MNTMEITSCVTRGVWKLWCARHRGRPDAGPLAYLEGCFDMVECVLPPEAMQEFDQVRGSLSEVMEEMDKTPEDWNIPLTAFRKRVGDLLKVGGIHGQEN